MNWTAADIPDLTGRTALVTGGNGGLGLECSRELSRAGARVVIAARDLDKAAAAVVEIRQTVTDPDVTVLELDLSSLDSIAAFANLVTADHDVIDILINNAGLMAMDNRRTADGFEIQLGTNHLGHFALTRQLMPLILRAERGRVVTVTSAARFAAPSADPEDSQLGDRYPAWRWYACSKMANLQFGIGLHQRLQAIQSPAESLVAHPGFSNTDLQANAARESEDSSTAGFFDDLVARVGMSPAVGVRPQLRAATDPNASSGQLYAPRFVASGAAVRRPLSGWSRDVARIDAMWALSEQLTGREFRLG